MVFYCVDFWSERHNKDKDVDKIRGEGSKTVCLEIGIELKINN